MRNILTSNAQYARKLDALERKYDSQFKVVFDAIRELMAPAPAKRRPIGLHRNSVKLVGLRRIVGRRPSRCYGLGTLLRTLDGRDDPRTDSVVVASAVAALRIAEELLKKHTFSFICKREHS